MTPDDELRAIAEAATPGPWKAEQGERVQIDFPTADEYASSLAVYSAEPYSKYGLIPHGILHANDARFVATFDPPTVKGLLDKIQWLEAENARLKKHNAEMMDFGKGLFNGWEYDPNEDICPECGGGLYVAENNGRDIVFCDSCDYHCDFK